MTHSKRETLAVARRRAKVAELYLQGVPQHEIATRLFGNAEAAARMTVSRDLAAVRKDAVQHSRRDYEAARGETLGELRLLRQKLWADYELTRRDKKGNARPGDPRLAAQLLACINEEAELLGLMPRRGTDPTTAPPVVAFVLHRQEGNGRPGPPTAEVVDQPPTGAAAELRLPPATPAPVYGLKELPPGADPAEYELVEEDMGNGEGLATEEGGAIPG
jgi:hypothetical protein